MHIVDNENFFKKLEHDRVATQMAYQKMIDRISNVIAKQCVDASNVMKDVQELLKYIEQGEGTITLQYIPQVQDIVRMLYILQMEIPRWEPGNEWCCLTHDCDGFDALYDKYRMTKFAIWRLYFKMSEMSVIEAKTFLEKNRISIYAKLVIAQNVLRLSPEEALGLLT